jgi:RHS repeat-associated protein
MIVPYPNKPYSDYRYGFQGQEKDDEIKGGEGKSLNYTFRMHDPRVGRFFAVDPLFREYPFYSPYVFSGNRVIDATELEGLEPHLLFNSITEAAANFGEQYNGYSIQNKFEIGTVFYKIKDGDTFKFAYAIPVHGQKADEKGGATVNPYSSILDSKIPSDAIFVGNAHTHANDNNDKNSIFIKPKFSNRLHEEVATDKDLNILKEQKLKGIYKFKLVDGSNGLNQYDISFWQDEIITLGDDFIASYTFTPSGLVWSTRNNNGKPKSDIQYKLSETNPSDENSIIRINNVDSNCIPEVLPTNTSNASDKIKKND